MNSWSELVELIRELRELLHSFRRPRIAVIVQQECVMSNPGVLVTGKSFQATAVAVDSSGNPVTTTFTWSVDNTAVASIDPSSGVGTLVGIAGAFNVNAIDPGGDVGTCPCTVTVAGPGVLKITVDVTQP